MNIYRISCYSKCGSYFQPYLKSVTVKAESKETAILYTKEWLSKTQNEFIYPEEEWYIRLVSEETDPVGVIDYDENSDY